MAERPPKGYDKRDKPLPHLFKYEFGLNLALETQNSVITTYMRTTKASNDPTTIEVNPRNAAFAVDAGAVICEESIVQRMSIMKTYYMSELTRVTDNIHALKMQNMMIKGVFEDSWTPADEKTGTKIEDIIEVTHDTTNMDVVPKVSTVDVPNSDDHPLSSVTISEVFGDYNLTGNRKIESVAFDVDTYFNCKKYYTNGGKLNQVAPSLNTFMLTERKGFVTQGGTKFIPRHMQFGRRDLLFAELHHLPMYNTTEQITDSFTAPTSAIAVTVKIICAFNEWNPDFDQKRG